MRVLILKYSNAGKEGIAFQDKDFPHYWTVQIFGTSYFLGLYIEEELQFLEEVKPTT